MLTKKQIIGALRKVNDPELGINIVALGLVYDVSIQNKKVDVAMTLTTIGCPLAAVIGAEVESKVKALGDVESVSTKFVFDPPWEVSRMSADARTLLGL